MPIPVRCSCGRIAQAPDIAAGQKIRCKGCGDILDVSTFAPNGVFEEEARPSAIAPKTKTTGIPLAGWACILAIPLIYGIASLLENRPSSQAVPEPVAQPAPAKAAGPRWKEDHEVSGWARYMADRLIPAAMKRPHTASIARESRQFQSHGFATLGRGPAKLWSYQGVVIAQNGFGAMDELPFVVSICQRSQRELEIYRIDIDGKTVLDTGLTPPDEPRQNATLPSQPRHLVSDEPEPSGPSPERIAELEERARRRAAIAKEQEANDAAKKAEARADASLAVAKNLERSGKKLAALKHFRETASAFPGTEGGASAGRNAKRLEEALTPSPKAKEETAASNAFRAARTLEEAGTMAKAREAYQLVVNSYPDTDGAKLASARLKALAP